MKTKKTTKKTAKKATKRAVKKATNPASPTYGKKLKVKAVKLVKEGRKVFLHLWQ